MTLELRNNNKELWILKGTKIPVTDDDNNITHEEILAKDFCILSLVDTEEEILLSVSQTTDGLYEGKTILLGGISYTIQNNFLSYGSDAIVPLCISDGEFGVAPILGMIVDYSIAESYGIISMLEPLTNVGYIPKIKINSDNTITLVEDLTAEPIPFDENKVPNLLNIPDDDILIYFSIYNNGLYIIGTNSNLIYTSTDGINFINNIQNPMHEGRICNMIFDGNKYVLLTRNGITAHIYTSIDLQNWTEITLNEQGDRLYYNNGFYLYEIVYNTNYKKHVAVSTDLQNWQYIEIPITLESDDYIKLYFDGTNFNYSSAKGSEIWTSNNGLDWKLKTILENNKRAEYIYAGDIDLILTCEKDMGMGINPKLLYSLDGQSFTEANILDFENELWLETASIIYNNGLYYLMSSERKDSDNNNNFLYIRKSIDGINWETLYKYKVADGITDVGSIYYNPLMLVEDRKYAFYNPKTSLVFGLNEQPQPEPELQIVYICF